MDRKHYKCLLWKGLWGLAALCFLSALLADYRGGLAFGIQNGMWYWNALVLAVLATPIKLDCHECGVCGISR